MSDGLSTTSAAYGDTDSQAMLGESTGEVAAISFAVPAPPLAKRDSTAAEPVQDEGTTLTQRLATFIGPNYEAYLDYYNDVFEAKNHGLLRHWHWAPFAFSVPWLFLRRRYAVALCSAILPIVLGLLLGPALGLLISLAAIAVICGLAGRPWYVRSALNKIAEIDSQRLWPVQRDEKLQDAGGVSLIGAVCGSIVWLAIVIGPYAAGWVS